MKKYLDLIVLVLWLVLVADVVVCAFKPNPITIVSVAISATVFILAFWLYIRERKKKK